MRASLGERWNQSMVHPEIKPGNFRARLRNFSPTCGTHTQERSLGLAGLAVERNMLVFYFLLNIQPCIVAWDIRYMLMHYCEVLSYQTEF